MAKTLTATIQNQIDTSDIKSTFTFNLESVDTSTYLMSWNISYSRQFGAASASFELDNNDARFSNGGALEINVGDIVEFIENFKGDLTNWKSFYGLVEQRSITKNAGKKTITLTCLDYISTLKKWDIDLQSEGTKVAITGETLTPNFLPEPNANLAQVFDFANNSIAENPRPIIIIRDVNNISNDFPQYDGFQTNYQTGQLRLGSPLNANLNYNIIADYSYYTKGIYAEDVLEEILVQPNGYGSFLFDEPNAAAVISNHLTTTFNAEEGTTTDVLLTNLTSSTITLETNLTSSNVLGAVSIAVTSTSGFPTSGTGEINGDIFTWSGKTSTTLTGIPASGGNSLSAHNSGDYVEYENTYDAGQVWFHRYTRIETNLVAGNYTIGGGGTFSHLDQRFGRIILTSAISLASVVTCDVDYTFSTLQATGIELNKISFRSREVANRFDAISKLRSYIAPNWIVRTQGDDLIWASYLSQRTVADYDLDLVLGIDFLEDEDLYTRVKFFGKNKNPTNLMFNDGVDFVTTGETYKGNAIDDELIYSLEEGNYYVYGSLISGAGYIDLEDNKPIVKINGIPIDDKLHEMIALPVEVEVTTVSDIKSGCHGISKESYTKIHTYYYYKVRFSHGSIEPAHPILVYDAVGVLQLTISAFDINMDYANGIYNVPGDARNSTIELLSTSTYQVFYSTDNLVIDYQNVLFKISKSLLQNRDASTVTASYTYWTTMTSVEEIAAIIDGRWDTQVQTEFYVEPPSGYNYAILDLGALYDISAIDIVSGFYKPDTSRKFDIDFNMTLKYSIDNITYFDISDETNNFRMGGGSSVSFGEGELGVSFQARYLKIVLENVKKIAFGGGLWAVAFAEISAYGDIILSSEATLIATTQTDGVLSGGEATVDVVSTEQFDSSGTGFIETDEFTYSGKTSTSFTGCSGVAAHSDGVRLSQTLETDTTLFDDDGLLQKLGDRLFKEVKISDETLYTQEELDRLSKAFLKEFYKDHTKITTNILYSPYIKMGNTIEITDSYNNVSAENYFVESIGNSNGKFNLVVGKFPA